jgi:hypothetical protein
VVIAAAVEASTALNGGTVRAWLAGGLAGGLPPKPTSALTIGTASRPFAMRCIHELVKER